MHRGKVRSLKRGGDGGVSGGSFVNCIPNAAAGSDGGHPRNGTERNGTEGVVARWAGFTSWMDRDRPIGNILITI